MAKKKISKKQSARLKRQNVILILIGIIFAVGIIFFTVNTLKQDQLDRKDREKFTRLEVKMQDAKAAFEKIAPDNKWEFKKTCDNANTPFPNDDHIGCSILLKSHVPTNTDTPEQLLSALSTVGFKKGATGTSGESQSVVITDLKPNIYDVFCSFILTKDSSSQAEVKVVFYCRSATHGYIYPSL